MTLMTRLVTGLIPRWLGMGPATTKHTVTRAVPVPMRDGVALLTDHYAPMRAARSAEPAGTLLVRSPYGRDGLEVALTAGAYAARGHHVVVQSARGTYGSGGEFVPGRSEVDDGADTVAWLRRQPWFTGRFATVGASYLGFTQWALLMDPAPELATAVITVGPHDFGEVPWGSGSFALSDLLSWSFMVAHQEDPGMIRSLIRSVTSRRRVASAMNALPLAAAGRALLGGRATWYESWLEHPDVDDEFWAPLRLHAALDRVQVPVLLIAGWQDVFLTQTVAQYRRLHERGVDVALTIGPWTHMQSGLHGARRITRERHDWLAEHLSDRPSRRSSPVRVYVTGGGGWRDMSSWPPPGQDRTLYLGAGARLSYDDATSALESSSFVYDPADPTPTVGGRLLSSDGGYRDDQRLARRADVLTFTGSALSADIEVMGSPVVELFHTTDVAHADVFVRLSEVDDAGRSRNVSDGYVRLDADRPSPLRIELDPAAHRFRAGRRIRLMIAGGSHPRFARNPGTGDPPSTATRLARCVHTVDHGGHKRSRLVLPVSIPPDAR